MGRAAITLRTQDVNSCLVDRSAKRLLLTHVGRNGAASVSAPRTGPVLSSTSETDDTRSCKTETSAEPEVVQLQLWHQLTVAERQRFGHCFSSLLLKALGLGPNSAEEVES